ncbi:nanos homolog 3 [Sceloporus undulatus]|uniref:nanos homolog 3 n=1 Tax=Sceloporus undulatus TaxID=8520 RepID=UPI001C4C8005|nr:nanos homolog 3 [Sceloporus undulatus]
MAFQLWKDYFQLAKVVEEMRNGEMMGMEMEEDQRGPQLAEARRPEEQPAIISCSFCRQNGESSHVYTSHRLKDESGRVQCPILRNYTCPQCGATQEQAHTRRFCPQTQRGYVSVYTSSIRNSAGKKKKSKSRKVGQQGSWG